MKRSLTFQQPFSRICFLQSIHKFGKANTWKYDKKLVILSNADEERDAIWLLVAVGEMSSRGWNARCRFGADNGPL